MLILNNVQRIPSLRIYLLATLYIILLFISIILFDRYLAYSSPSMTSKGKSMLLFSVFDKKLRKAFRKFYKSPLNIFRKLHYQTVMIIQPVDFLEDGRQNMCDGCPDITVWNGQLVWSCRMEEQLKFGHNLKSYPKDFLN
mgnify:CR=1 FL=1